MDNNKLFIFVTQSGSAYDRSNGKNERIVFGKAYGGTLGEFNFIKKENKTIEVSFSDNSGSLKYKKEISEPGMYCITSLFIQALPGASKEVRVLYNRMKRLSGSPRFKLMEDINFDEPVNIQFHAKNDGGVLETRFILKVNPNLLSQGHVERAIAEIEDFFKLDVDAILENFRLDNNREVTFTINEEFSKTLHRKANT